MFPYFRYLSLNFLKKKTTWLSALIFWTYIALVVIIVPVILKVDPMSIWNNSIMDVSAYTLTLLAIVCAVFAVIIFRDGRDDGSELIIISKPITRAKIIATKFISFFIWTTIIILIALGLISCTFFLGENSSSNPGGMDFAKIPFLVLSTFIGCMIIVFLFGAIAVLISMITGKVGVMVGTIGITVFLNLFYMVAPAIVTDAKTYLQDEHGVNMKSCRVLDTTGKQSNVTWRTSDVSDPEGKTSYEWSQIGLEKSSVYEVATVNIEAQMCQIFKSFGVEEQESINMKSFGSSSERRFDVNDEKFLDENMRLKSEPSAFPLFSVTTTNVSEIKNVKFSFVGTNINDFTIYSVLGQKSDDFGLVMVMNQDLGGKFYDWNDFNQPVFTEGKVKEDIDNLLGVWMTAAILPTKAKVREDIYTKIFIENRTELFKVDDFDEVTSEQMNFSFLAVLLQMLISVDNDLLTNYVDAMETPEKFNGEYNKNGKFAKDVKFTREFAGVSQKHKGFYDKKTNINDVPNNNGWDEDLKAELYFGSDSVENWASVQDLFEYKVEKIFSSQDIITFWASFSIVLYFIAILVYTRTDFK